MIVAALKLAWSFLTGFIGKAISWIFANPLAAAGIAAGAVIALMGVHIHRQNGRIATANSTIALQQVANQAIADANASIYAANRELVDANAKLAGANQEVRELAAKAEQAAQASAAKAARDIAAAQSAREAIYAKSPEARAWADQPVPADVLASLRAAQASGSR